MITSSIVPARPWRTIALLCSLLLISACGIPDPQVVSVPTGTPLPAPTPESSDPPAATPTVAAEPTTAPSAQNAITLVDDQNNVVLLDGDERRILAKVAETPSLCNVMRWSPDGWRLALPDGIYTLNDDLTAPPRIAPIVGSDFRWSPDGSRLAWLAGVDEHLDAIRVGGPDGDEPRAIGGTHWGSTGLIEWNGSGDLVLSGRLQAYADGNLAEVIENRGPNTTYSPVDDAVLWTTFEITGTDATITLMQADHGPEPMARGSIDLTLNDPNAIMFDLERIRLRWLPTGDLLLPVPPASVQSGGGTYILRQNAISLLTPHLVCDVSPDGSQLLARTTDNRIVLLAADGSEQAVVGSGSVAAFRPTPRGSAPDAPLAAKSPTLSLTTPRIEGEAVRELQQRLSDAGIDVGAIDGVFGPQTEAGVRAFQESVGIPADGIVGPQTWGWLRFDADEPIPQLSTR
jgi:hypothetical protein